jgi:branched-subunit amino acid aminotransferase/4-amino-4-deoxychorismate lyase
LEQGTITEQVLYPQDLQRAEEIWLINSVRGWLRAKLTCNIFTTEDSEGLRGKTKNKQKAISKT